MPASKKRDDDQPPAEEYHGEPTASNVAVPTPWPPYDENMARRQQEQYMLTTYVELVIKADQADVIPNDEARERVTKALDRLKAMAEGMAS